MRPLPRRLLITAYASLSACACVIPVVASAHVPVTWTVEINERGFFPETLTILQGDTIRFENRGTKDHWPASDIHPTHGIYPSFDPGKGFPAGDHWSFRFTRAGTFRMHDHLWPLFTGTVTVQRDADFLEVIEEDVSPSLSNTWRLLWDRIFLAIFPSQRDRSLTRVDVRMLAEGDEPTLARAMAVYGPTPLLERLLSQSGGGSTIDCHTPAHKLGRAAYLALGAAAFAEGDASCHSGFYHGAMEVLLQQEGTEDLAATARRICKTFDTNFGIFECLHGIGHGLLASENYDLPAAMRLCEELETPFDQSSCLGGMFMENIVTGLGIGATTSHETKWLSDDPQFPCNAFDPNDVTIQRECYQMQTSWMYKLFPGDDKRVVEECHKATELGKRPCFVSYGRDGAGTTLRDPEGIRGKCALIPEDDLRQQCLWGGLNVIIDFWGSGLKNQASDLCRILEGGEKEACYRTIAGRLTELFSTADDRRIVCDGFEAEFQALCSQEIIGTVME